MAVNKSYLVATAAVVAIVVWFGVNSRGGPVDVYEARADVERVVELPSVVVQPSTAREYPVRLSSYGQTLPNRTVDVRAETVGPVVAAPVREGERVERGAVLCRQDVAAREAVVAQARAEVAKAQADLAATERLVREGFRSSASLASDRADRDAATARLTQAQDELDNVVIRAPFAGVFNERVAELGDYLGPGQTCGTVVELDPLRVEIELGERQVGSLAPGQEIEVALATGETVVGDIIFIESRANPATRTFRVEAAVPNPDGRLRAGVSATVGLQTGTVDAHLVPAGVLALDEGGRTGVRHLDRSNRVVFTPVDVVDETPEGLWVSGLPATARVITQGQDFVSEGARVRARTAGGAEVGPSSPIAIDATAGG